MTLQSGTGDIQSLMEHLGRVEQGVQQTLQNIDIWNRQRLTASTRWASGEIQHAMESGQNGTGAAALTSLITDCQAVRHHEDHVLAERLEPYLVTLRELLHQAAKRLGVEWHDGTRHVTLRCGGWLAAKEGFLRSRVGGNIAICTHSNLLKPFCTVCILSNRPPQRRRTKPRKSAVGRIF